MPSNGMAQREAATWTAILEHIQSRVTEQKFDTWYRKLQPVSLCDDLVLLEVPNAFFVDFFEEYNIPTLKESVHQVLGTHPAIRFQVRKSDDGSSERDQPSEVLPMKNPSEPSPAVTHAPDDTPPSTDADASENTNILASTIADRVRRIAYDAAEKSTPTETAEPLTAGPPRRIQLETNGQRTNGAFRQRFTFDNFVVGRGNEFAYAACQAVANDPARTYNPLFLHGGVGLGKTHLMHAIGAEVSARNPGAKICYVSTEQFMNEMIESIQRGSTIEFRNRYRKLDMLLIDDIQFLAGKESTQDEFFHTFNTLHGSNKQVVIASDRAPKDIQNLEERLISRFHWGLVSDIQPPDLETRMAILRAKAEEKRITVPPDVILEIAKLIQTNIRELEGSLIRIKAFADLLRSPINVGLVQEALADYIREHARRPIDVMDVQKYVAQAYGVPPESLRGKRRTNTVAHARQVAVYLTKELTDLTVVEIGRRFGNRDHSTVLHAVKKVRQLMVEEPEVRVRIEQMKHELESLSQRS
ncbi:MAG: chromosomal replication initiator protein DnaA [Candidatus Eisenbacteria bacterium]